LHGNEGHVVRDHVVQFARDSSALFQHCAVGLFALDVGGLYRELMPGSAPAVDRVESDRQCDGYQGGDCRPLQVPFRRQPPAQCDRQAAHCDRQAAHPP
jgi:hypothetical protein